MATVKAPADLQAAGKKMWRDVTTEYELSSSELALLREACRTTDELEILRAAILDSELITTGSTGQPVVNRLFDEVRKHRDSLNKTVATLALPMSDEEELKPATVTHLKAKKAAEARWSKNRASNG